MEGLAGPNPTAIYHGTLSPSPIPEPMTKLTLPAGAVVLLAIASPLNAALIAYESFNYSSISGGTATTGSGFNGSWVVGQGGVNVTTGLTYSTLPSEFSAGQTTGPTRAKESLASPITSGTVFTTLLLKNSGNSGGDGAGFILSGTSGNLFVGFGAGFSADQTGFGLGAIGSGNGWGNPTSFTNAANISNTAIHFIALSTDLATNSTSLWINPTVANVAAGTLGTPSLTISSVTLGSITGIGMNAISAQTTIDEVRIGDSWASVAGVPEPSASAGIFGIGGLILLLRRRGSGR